MTQSEILYWLARENMGEPHPLFICSELRDFEGTQDIRYKAYADPSWHLLENPICGEGITISRALEDLRNKMQEELQRVRGLHRDPWVPSTEEIHPNRINVQQDPTTGNISMSLDAPNGNMSTDEVREYLCNALGVPDEFLHTRPGGSMELSRRIIEPQNRYYLERLQSILEDAGFSIGLRVPQHLVDNQAPVIQSPNISATGIGIGMYHPRSIERLELSSEPSLPITQDEEVNDLGYDVQAEREALAQEFAEHSSQEELFSTFVYRPTNAGDEVSQVQTYSGSNSRNRPTVDWSDEE